MGIGSLFHSGSRGEKALRQLRNNSDHKKLAKQIYETAKEVDAAVKRETPSRSATDRENILRAAEQVLDESVKDKVVKDKKNKSINIDAFQEEESKLMKTHQELLKLIPNKTEEDIQKDIQKLQQAMKQDREKLAKTLAEAAIDQDSSINERAGSLAKFIKVFIEDLPSVDQIQSSDRKTRDNLRELQGAMLTANAVINNAYQSKQLTVNLTSIRNLEENPIVLVLENDSIVDEVVNRFLAYQKPTELNQTEEQEGDDEEEDYQPDLYRREKIDKFRKGGHWWHNISHGELLQKHANEDGKVTLDWVSMDDDSYTLAVVDDGTSERGLPLALCKRKKDAGQVQKTIEAEVSKMLPKGKVVAIKTFGDNFSDDRPVCEYALLSSYFKAKHTEFHVEVNVPRSKESS